MLIAPFKGRALIADDHPVVRDALRLVLHSKWPDLAIDEVGSIGEVESAIRGQTDYRLIILDLMLPDAHGFSGLIFLKKMLEHTPVVMISSRHDAQTLASARILGASGFAPKSMGMAEMIQVFERAMEGRTSFPGAPKADPAGTLNLAQASRRVASLSGAQLRVLLALADGKLNKQIAADMRVTEATVKAHLTATFRKLSVHNRTQAILLAQPLLDSGQIG